MKEKKKIYFEKEKKLKRELEEIKKLEENVGIEDLMAVYGEYQKAMQISAEYLKEMNVKFTFSTTDTSF